MGDHLALLYNTNHISLDVCLCVCVFVCGGGRGYVETTAECHVTHDALHGLYYRMSL